MASKEIKETKLGRDLFVIGDGFMPTQRKTDGCFEILNPFEFVLKPGQQTKINTGIRCINAIHLMPAWEQKSKGAEFVDGIWAAHDADPNNNIVVIIKNSTDADMFFEAKEVIARFAVFTYPTTN